MSETKKKKKKRKIYIHIPHKMRRGIKKTALVVLSAFLIIYVFAHLEDWITPETSMPEEADTEGQIFYNGAWYALREDVETLLLFGVDKYEAQIDTGFYTNDQQSDFLLLMVVDEKTNTCRALPLNRDTMTTIARLDLNGGVESTFTGQLALAHTYGSGGEDSGRNTARAVSSLLYGVPVEHYLGFSMDAVAILNDAVGGVSVKVEDDFSAITDKLPKGQTVTLKGDLALTYVRSRSGVGQQSNLERMGRQQQYMAGFYPLWQSHVAEDPYFLASTMVEVSDYVYTDCSIERLSEVNSLMSECTFQLLDAPAGEAREGEEFMEFYVDEDALRQTVVDLFYEKVK